MDTKKVKLIAFGILAVIVIYISSSSLFGYNIAGYRTWIQYPTGTVEVKFNPGFFYEGFGKTVVYPDVITANFNHENTGSSIDLPRIPIRFNDATSAEAEGVVKFVLPKGEKEMLQIHNDYRSLDNLVATGLKPFVIECLKNSAQLMSSEMHYLGGRSTMSQYFQDQLENGVYILNTEEKLIKDTLDKETKRIYITQITKDKNGNSIRKKSVLTQYKISISDAVISDVDYENRVDQMLTQKIDATSKTSISKQKLMQAQQEALTAKATGEKNLVTTEYAERQAQIKSVINSETQVTIAEQDKLKQKIAYEASQFEAKKIKELAEAEAYKRKSIMVADGALEIRLTKQVEIQKAWADAFAKSQQPLVPHTYFGGGDSKNSPNALETMSKIMMMNSLENSKK